MPVDFANDEYVGSMLDRLRQRPEPVGVEDIYSFTHQPWFRRGISDDEEYERELMEERRREAEQAREPQRDIFGDIENQYFNPPETPQNVLQRIKAGKKPPVQEAAPEDAYTRAIKRKRVKEIGLKKKEKEAFDISDLYDHFKILYPEQKEYIEANQKAGVPPSQVERNIGRMMIGAMPEPTEWTEYKQKKTKHEQIESEQEEKKRYTKTKMLETLGINEADEYGQVRPYHEVQDLYTSKIAQDKKTQAIIESDEANELLALYSRVPQTNNVVWKMMEHGVHPKRIKQVLKSKGMIPYDLKWMKMNPEIASKMLKKLYYTDKEIKDMGIESIEDILLSPEFTEETPEQW